METQIRIELAQFVLSYYRMVSKNQEAWISLIQRFLISLPTSLWIDLHIWSQETKDILSQEPDLFELFRQEYRDYVDEISH